MNTEEFRQAMDNARSEAEAQAIVNVYATTPPQTSNSRGKAVGRAVMESVVAWTPITYTPGSEG